MFKKIKPIYIILGLGGLSLIILSITTILNQTIKQKSTVSLTITSSQENVQGLIDQNIPELEQPFTLPISLSLKPGQYTFQFYKTGYENKTINLNLNQNQTLDIFLNKKTIVGDFYRIPTETDVSAVGWRDDLILYQVSNRLKEARTNSTLVSLPSENIASISQTGVVVTQHNGSLYLIERPPKVRGSDIAAEKTRISPDGQKVAVLSGNTITVYNLNLESLARFEFENTIQELNWFNNYQIGISTTDSSKQTQFYLLDTNAQTQHLRLVTEDPINHFSFSTDGKFLAVHSTVAFSIYNSQGELVYNLPAENSLINSLGIWRANSQLILIEKHQEQFARNAYREIDKIWLINPVENSRQFIALSAPIPNKINFDVVPTLSNNKNALIVAENRGQVWLLLLEGKIQQFLPDYRSPPETLPYSAP